jgi:hypothetical protein
MHVLTYSLSKLFVPSLILPIPIIIYLNWIFIMKFQVLIDIHCQDFSVATQVLVLEIATSVVCNFCGSMLNEKFQMIYFIWYILYYH